MGTMTGRKAPITQITWNRASKRANELPRWASGASRCTMASNACLPAVDDPATNSASSPAPSSPPRPAATRAAIAGHEERPLEDPLLGRHPPQHRSEHRPDQPADHRQGDDDAEVPRRGGGRGAGAGRVEPGRHPNRPAECEADRDGPVLAASPQVEGEQEGEEADDPAQHAHRRTPEHDPGALELGGGRRRFGAGLDRFVG